MLFYTMLYYAILCNTILCYTMLYYTILYYTILYYNAVQCMQLVVGCSWRFTYHDRDNYATFSEAMYKASYLFAHGLHVCTSFSRQRFSTACSLTSTFRHTKELLCAGDIFFKCHLGLGRTTHCGTKWLPHWVLSQLLHWCRSLAHSEEGQRVSHNPQWAATPQGGGGQCGCCEHQWHWSVHTPFSTPDTSWQWVGVPRVHSITASAHAYIQYLPLEHKKCSKMPSFILCSHRVWFDRAPAHNDNH